MGLGKEFSTLIKFFLLTVKWVGIWKIWIIDAWEAFAEIKSLEYTK